MAIGPINKLSNIRKQISSSSLFKVIERRNKPEYTLLSKTEQLPITEFPRDSWAIQSDAVTFRVVKVGKKSNPEYSKEITTFYDIQNRPIAKCFQGSDIDYKMRTYKYSTGVTSTNQPSNIRTITIEEAKRGKQSADDCNLKFLSAFGLWNKISEEMQCVTDIGGLKKLSTLKTLFHKDKRDVTLTEYPLKSGTFLIDKMKRLNFVLKGKEDNFAIDKIEHTPNVSIPKKDKYLPIRFLSDEEKCKSLSYFYLRQKGLDKLGLTVEIPSRKVDPSAAAYFSSHEAAIRWRCVPEYRPIVSVAAHEAEHAYQHAQIGRLTCGETEYEKRCRKKFGKIKDIKERKEALNLFDAQKSYPSNFDPDYPRKHDENYLEIKAEVAAEKAFKEYSEGQNVLKESFKYFPNTHNMF